MKALPSSLGTHAHACSFKSLGILTSVLCYLSHLLHRFISSSAINLIAHIRQRLAIARALLRQPNILIFDEAVSNLDQSTSEQFAQTINRLKGKVTILFITNQLPKGLQVDEAVVLGKTEINQANNQCASEVSKVE